MARLALPAEVQHPLSRYQPTFTVSSRLSRSSSGSSASPVGDDRRGQFEAERFVDDDGELLGRPRSHPTTSRQRAAIELDRPPAVGAGGRSPSVPMVVRGSSGMTICRLGAAAGGGGAQSPREQRARLGARLDGPDPMISPRRQAEAGKGNRITAASWWNLLRGRTRFEVRDGRVAWRQPGYGEPRERGGRFSESVLGGGVRPFSSSLVRPRSGRWNRAVGSCDDLPSPAGDMEEAATETAPCWWPLPPPPNPPMPPPSTSPAPDRISVDQRVPELNFADRLVDDLG